jgi:hypothetical protein
MNGRQRSVLYCPSCRDEFEAWVITCPDCGVGTVTALPPDETDVEPAPEPVAVVTLDLHHLTDRQLEALRWRLQVEGAAVHWLDAYRVEVPEPDVASVEAFLAEIEAEEDDGGTARRPDTLGDYVLASALARGSLMGRLLAWWKNR